jgi:hypothetical protein
MSNQMANQRNCTDELKKKTNQLRESCDSDDKDLWKIGKCIECYEWFLVTNKSDYGHSYCDGCVEHLVKEK